MRKIFIIVTMTTALLLAVGMVFAQDSECSIFVAEAISTTAQSCANIASNEICFGHTSVAPIVNCDALPAFNAPGDTISLNATCALRSSAMQIPDKWGIAVMKAPIHDIDGDLTFVLLGDVQIHNAATALSDIQVWVDDDAEIRSGPGSHYDQMGTLAAGTVIRVNACNCTQNWLRTLLDNHQVGWIPSDHVSVVGDVNTLPVAKVETPIYNAMQAFTLHTGAQPPACAESPDNGILIQVPAGVGAVPLQINGVEIVLDSTLFVQSQPGSALTITVLDGTAQVMANDFTAYAVAGLRVNVPMSDENLPAGLMTIEPYAEETAAKLPVSLLPTRIDAANEPNREMTQITGVERCTVVSGQSNTACAVHFVNEDGDPITRMDVEFVNAPQGEWESAVKKQPALIDGDNVSGRLAWNPTCSVGDTNFIGPVVWSITITDEAGHVSAPFEAAFNCVDG